MTSMGGMFDDQDLAELHSLFLEEGREQLEALNLALLTVERAPETSADDINDAFRAAHSLKGMAASMGFDGMARLAHAAEDLLAQLRSRERIADTDTVAILLRASDAIGALVEEIAASGAEQSLVDTLCADVHAACRVEPTGDTPRQLGVAGTSTPATSRALSRAQTVRVDATRLDELMHGVGELLVHRARLQNVTRSSKDRDVLEAVDQLDRAARALQELVMDVRMVSVDMVLRRMPRLVRDLAAQLGKEVELEITGRETELDRTVIDVLGDPLVHLVRNALDHGIEAPSERALAGKERAGRLTIAASAEGGSVTIEVRDDGSGMDPERIREVAVRRGVLSAAAAAALDDHEAFQLCFEPGFSTRDQVTDVSGRGVGLDAVRDSVRMLGGEVEVVSTSAGTTMSIRLPITLAIRLVLLVRCGADVYGIHADRVGQTVNLRLNPPRQVAGESTLLHQDRVVPLVDLGHALGDAAPAADRSFAVLVEQADGTETGLMVDDVIGQLEVVTRPLPAATPASALLSASAVLGDGEVAFLVDVTRLHEQWRGERTLRAA